MEKKIDRTETANRRVSSGARITNKALDTVGKRKVDPDIKKTDAYKNAKRVVNTHNFATGVDYYWTYYSAGLTNLVGLRDAYRTSTLANIGRAYEKNEKYRNRVNTFDRQ